MPHKTELLFDEDPLTGSKTYFVMEDGSDDFQLITKQPIDAVLAAAQEARKATTVRTPWKGDIHQVASIPGVVYAELCRKGIAFDENEMRKWLNDPENKVFRVRAGRV